MATTINSYSVSLAMDASSYIKNSALSRKETTSLNRAINMARSPAEKYERSINQLDKALKKGAISQGTYNRLVDSASSKLKKATTETKKLESASTKAASAIKGLVAGYAGMAGVQRAISGVREQMLEVDRIAKSSRAIGENANQVQRFQFALGEIAGVEGQQAIELLKVMEKNVGLTSMGVGRAKEAFEQLGISVDVMLAKSPVEKFNLIRDAFSKIETQTEKAALASRIFGEQGISLLPVLDATSEAFASSAANVDRLGLAFDSIDSSRIEGANDAIGRLSASIAGAYRTLAANPIVEKLADIASMALAVDTALSRLRFAGTSGKARALVTLGELTGAISGGDASKINRALDKAGSATAATTGASSIGGAASSARAPIVQEEKQLLQQRKQFAVAHHQRQSRIQNMQQRGLMQQNRMRQFEQRQAAKGDSPAIKALEVGTQEAFSFLTQQAKEKQEVVKIQREQSRELKISNQRLAEIKAALKENGFKRFR